MESQVKRFDPECEYIKKWVPELANEDPVDIMKGNVKYIQAIVKGKMEILKPIVEDLKEARKEGIQMYKDSIEASK